MKDLFRARLALGIAVALVASLAVVLAPGADASDDAPELSTPDLIGRAVSNGHLSSAAGNRYLAYALTGTPSLPPRFRSDVGWDGTIARLQLQRAMPTASAADRRLFTRALNGPATATTVETCGNSTASLPDTKTTTHFYIRYDAGTIGGGLTVNDYANALEGAWSKEVTDFGWAAPPVLASNPPPNNKYFVRIDATPSVENGFAANQGTHAGKVGNNPNTSWNDRYAQASCIVMRRDFSGQATTPDKIVKSVAAHELAHSLQFGLGVLDQALNVSLFFVEGGAMWMEDEVYDDANVGYYFLWPSVGVGIEPYIPDPTDPVYTYPAPYNFWLTLRGLTEKYGHGTAGGSEQVMQDLWEALSKGTTPSPVNALALALQNKGDVLVDRVHDYVVAERFSRGCTGGYSGPYCLQEGDDYVSTVGAPPLDPSESMASVGDSWPPYYRATNGNYGTLDASLPSGSNYAVSITNQTERGSLFARVACDTGSSIQILGTASGVTARQTSSLGTIDTSGCSSPPYALVTDDELGWIQGNVGFAPVGKFLVKTGNTAYHDLTVSVTATGAGQGGVAAPVGGGMIGCNVHEPWNDWAQDCYQSIKAGDSVTLTEIPQPGSTFDGWSGDCAGTPSDQDCQLTMSKNMNVTVNFTAPPDTTPPSPPVITLSPNRRYLRSPSIGVTWIQNLSPDLASIDVSYDRFAYDDPNGAGPTTTLWQDHVQSGSGTLSGMTPGSTYCFTGRARDLYDNLSDPSYPPQCTAAPLDDRALPSHGTWARKGGQTGAYFQTLSVSKQQGAWLRVPTKLLFEAAVILEKCPGCGVVKIVQGYQLVTKLNLNAKRVHHWVTFPIESNPTSPTTETVKFVVVSSGKPVKIDGVAFFRTA